MTGWLCPACGRAGTIETRLDRTLYWHPDELWPCSVRADARDDVWQVVR